MIKDFKTFVNENNNDERLYGLPLEQEERDVASKMRGWMRVIDSMVNDTKSQQEQTSTDFAKDMYPKLIEWGYDKPMKGSDGTEHMSTEDKYIFTETDDENERINRIRETYIKRFNAHIERCKNVRDEFVKFYHKNQKGISKSWFNEWYERLDSIFSIKPLD